MKIAPDVEKLMWMAAESGDPQAIAEFEARFPHLRHELVNRLEMVRRLKASGKAAKPYSIPRFQAPLRQASPFGRFRWSLAAVALTALAFGSYYATQQIIVRPDTTQPPVHQPVEPEIKLPATGPDEPTVSPSVGGVPKPTEPGVQPPEDQPPPEAPWAKPIRVEFKKIGLKNAVAAIAAQAGMKLEMGPGLPNDEIVVHYENMTGLEILQDMASRFGFTVFDQGEGSVLVIPARPNEDEPTKSSAPPSTNVRNEG